MKLHSLGKRPIRGYTTWGCMWEKGKCDRAASYRVRGEKGEVASQSRIMAYWPDGSVKWTAHTADASLLGAEIEVAVREEGTKPYPAKEILRIEKTAGGMKIYAGSMTLRIEEAGHSLFEEIVYEGEVRMGQAQPVLVLEEPGEWKGQKIRVEKNYRANIRSVEIEEEGPVYAVIKYVGDHVGREGDTRIPFIIRMRLGLDSDRIGFVHTFLYDGEEDRDFLKGIGIRFTCPLRGQIYNRHVKFTGDYGCFHEAAAQLLSWRPRVPDHIYERQMKGEVLELEGEEAEIVSTVTGAMPFWNEYQFFQDRVNHFTIRKKTRGEDCCLLHCMDGCRSEGGAALGGENGSVLFSIRDFWEKYPSGYTFQGMEGEEAQATVWFWTPDGEPMDFRHYAQRGYNQTYYEGYDYKGATPYGIACTSQCSVGFSRKLIPDDRELEDFAENTKHPVQYVGEPEFYHNMRAFGYWSLPGRKTQMEQWLEDQVEACVSFYREEVRQRGWYGMFNYGDVMHTYDRERHVWRYDMGGYAWDNTELVPTLWLWYQFMRTGEEAVFELAEQLTRHTSEVDVYHLGPYKGLGSRHNVSHWGCPCKEARIAMAAHHRFYYYLTGDERLADIFEELKDNERTFLEKDPLGDFYDRKDMVYPSHARSGPDWSSLCANWMTAWERDNNKVYRDKILTGIEDIRQAPLQLISGPDFEFDPESVHLRYIGERASGGTHLQICMGAPQVWMELADLLDHEDWKKMLADYGRFYYLSREDQVKESGGILGDREFSLPFMAAAMGAYGAAYRCEKELAVTTWRILLHALIHGDDSRGFQVTILENAGNHALLREIPWISTNFAAQWCLNVIVALEFIREALPASLGEAKDLVAAMPEEAFRKA